MSVVSKVKSKVQQALPKTVSFSGSLGQAWFCGALERAPSMAGFFCGHDAGQSSTERLLRSKIAKRCLDKGANGTAAIYCPGPNVPRLSELDGAAVDVPLRIELKKPLPATEDDLMAGIKTSTTREDLRRIRKAGFTYRITTDPEDIRTFHSRFYVPLINQQFPEDGSILSLEKMLKTGEQREIVCAYLDGEWVAGIMNQTQDGNYAMAQLGIRDADEAVRKSRVVSALLVRSMQRAVELNLETTTLGFSLPFLGKGPIWFKAKWGSALTFEPRRPTMQVLLDLRHAAIRNALATCPILHSEEGALVATGWLEPGEAPLKALAREAERYTGIAQWYILGETETLAAASEVLAANDRVIPLAITPTGPEPIWLGTYLKSHRSG
ncbi:GNAT family N-acetyltransferase [Rhodobacteraceae bacterium]|nr:GNAT family N-acetyltransferase [Paracoccaceae bacterium]